MLCAETHDPQAKTELLADGLGVVLRSLRNDDAQVTAGLGAASG